MSDHERTPSHLAPPARSGKTSAATDPPPLLISRTKVRAPTLQAATLTRQRLIDWLRDHTSNRITLIVAEAGYGKTTLLGDFARHVDLQCLWYRLDVTDRDWVTCTNYLIGACREIEPAFGRATSDLLSTVATHNPPREVVLGSLLAELDTLGDRRLIVILDDFHLVDGSEDMEAIVLKLLHEAPPSMSFVISTRRRPRLPLARFAAQGALHTLTTNDLRFSEGETAQLFAETYQRPLDQDQLHTIDTRTEGWAASLQLLHSSIKGRSTSEARSVIASLNGASGSLYDFLAEEVMGRLSRPLQQFLIRASILEQVTPDLVAAALPEDSTGTPPPQSQIARWISEARDLGLLQLETSHLPAHRFHPLLHEFLQRQLNEIVPDEEQRAAHLRIASQAVQHDQLTAARHYILADRTEDAVRTIELAAPSIIRKGRWDDAVPLLTDLAGPLSTPEHTMIRARELLSHGKPAQALKLLETYDENELIPHLRIAYRQTIISSAWNCGDSRRFLDSLHNQYNDPTISPDDREIAHALYEMVGFGQGQTVSERKERLLNLAQSQASKEQYFYAAISLHNAIGWALDEGHPEQGLSIGSDALRYLSFIAPNPLQERSTFASLATCALELGITSEALEYQRKALEPEIPSIDALAECALDSAICGWATRARRLVEQCRQRFPHSERNEPMAEAQLQLAEAMVSIIEGDPEHALDTLTRRRNPELSGISPTLHRYIIESIALQLLGQTEAAIERYDQALSLALQTRAQRWLCRLEIMVGIFRRDGPRVEEAIKAADRKSMLATAELADLIGSNLDLLSNPHTILEPSVSRWPDRWLSVLRRQLSTSPLTSNVWIASNLISEYGQSEDIPRLVALESYIKRPSQRTLSKALMKRVGDRLSINDLGRGWLTVGQRSFELGSMRRKAASLLYLLIASPNQSATKDQVLDSLWPESDIDAALNSLNQTLYYARRALDPWYGEGLSLDYIESNQDLLWIDNDTVSINSVLFVGKAQEALRSRDLDLVSSSIGMYHGKFGPEFEYEDWAVEWRDFVHNIYIANVTYLRRELVRLRRFEEAIAIARSTISLDPSATEAEHDLVWLYKAIGLHSASERQYQHYAADQRTNYGVEPESFLELVAKDPLDRDG